MTMMSHHHSARRGSAPDDGNGRIDRHGRFRYSDLGYVLVGAAIDRLAGSYEQAMNDLVLDPLGINSTGFGVPPDMWGQQPRVQPGDIGISRGPIEEVGMASARGPRDRSDFFPGIGLVSGAGVGMLAGVVLCQALVWPPRRLWSSGAGYGGTAHARTDHTISSRTSRI